MLVSSLIIRKVTVESLTVFWEQTCGGMLTVCSLGKSALNTVCCCFVDGAVASLARDQKKENKDQHIWFTILHEVLSKICSIFCTRMSHRQMTNIPFWERWTGRRKINNLDLPPKRYRREKPVDLDLPPTVSRRTDGRQGLLTKREQHHDLNFTSSNSLWKSDKRIHSMTAS